MRHRLILLASIVLAATFALTTVASAGHTVKKSKTVKRQELSRTRIAGTIESIRGNQATIITENGEYVGVGLGPRKHWGRYDGQLREGARVTMDCWGDPYGRTDWYFAGSVWGPGFHFELTNDYGVPNWVDYRYDDDWCPTYDTYADWYGCGHQVYTYVLPPPPPVRYYYWYPRGYYPDRYRHHYRRYDYGRHDRGNHYGWRNQDRDRDDDHEWDRDRDRDRDRRHDGPIGRPDNPQRDGRRGPRGR